MGRDNIDAAPDWGYCASQGLHYYGYKLHAVCGIRGVIHSFDMTAASVHDLHYLKDVQWEYHDCMMLGDKGYLSAEVQQNLFDTANITLEVPYRLNQKNWRPPSWAYKRYRKRIETIFSQLNDNLMMIRNYAKQTCGLFTRMASKIAAMTFMQYVNFVNHRPIGQNIIQQRDYVIGTPRASSWALSLAEVSAFLHSLSRRTMRCRHSILMASLVDSLDVRLFSTIRLLII